MWLSFVTAFRRVVAHCGDSLDRFALKQCWAYKQVKYVLTFVCIYIKRIYKYKHNVRKILRCKCLNSSKSLREFYENTKLNAQAHKRYLQTHTRTHTYVYLYVYIYGH